MVLPLLLLLVMCHGIGAGCRSGGRNFFDFVAGGIMVRHLASGANRRLRLLVEARCVDWTRCCVGGLILFELDGDGFALAGSILR